MQSSKVFIDESGNTGDDLLNLDQPIFALVGVGVDAKAERKVKSAIVNLRKKYCIAKGQELKGQRLLRGRKKWLIKDLADAIFQSDGMVFLVLVEKRFNVCSFIVDDLFDPAYNDNCDNSWTHFRPEKIQIAEIFYDHLSGETLRLAAQFLRSGQGITELFERLLHELRSVNYSIPLAQTVSGVRSHLEHLSAVVASISGANQDIEVASGVMNSPNYFSFFDLMNKAEFFYSQRRARARLIFDSARQFDESFAAAFRRLKRARRAVLYERPGSIPFILGYRAIRDFTTASSNRTPLLQCGDLLATGIAQTVKKINAGGSPEDQVDFALLGLPGALGPFFTCIVSARLVSRMASALSNPLSRNLRP